MNLLKKISLLLLPSISVALLYFFLPISENFKKNLTLTPTESLYFPRIEGIFAIILLITSLVIILKILTYELGKEFQLFGKNFAPSTGKNLSFSGWLFLFLIPVSSMALSKILNLEGHKVLFDEAIYISIAENILRSFDFRLPYEVLFKDKAITTLALPDKHPVGFSVLLTPFIATKNLFETSYGYLFKANSLALLFSSQILTILVFKLTMSKSCSYITSILFCLSPLTLFWHSSGSIFLHFIFCTY
jgi:hypothetical protein